MEEWKKVYEEDVDILDDFVKKTGKTRSELVSTITDDILKKGLYYVFYDDGEKAYIYSGPIETWDKRLPLSALQGGN